MGRSRGGLTGKIHALVDACGLPVKLSLSEGHAYDADAIRDLIASQDAFANIPPMSNRRRRSAISEYLYKLRNMVERFFNKLKHFRAVETRYEKNPLNNWQE